MRTLVRVRRLTIRSTGVSVSGIAEKKEIHLYDARPLTRQFLSVSRSQESRSANKHSEPTS